MVRKGRIVTSFSYDLQEDPIVDEFERIAAQEGLDKSKMIMKLIRDHVAKHSKGNSSFRLDQFGDSRFLALPTMGEILDPSKLDPMEDQDLDQLGKASKARLDEIKAAANRRKWDDWTHRWMRD